MANDRCAAGFFGLALLAGLGVLLPLSIARSIPLVDPDEGLHASIAQEMVERGDWIVPHQVNDPFLDKPILYFWAIAASLKIFGMSEAAVRLPGLLCGLLGTLTTTAIAWRLLDRRTGLIAGIFYASMILPSALIQVPTHDVALIPLANLALLFFWESDRGGSLRGWTWTAAAGLVLGLAILTKGLAGVALTGITYGGYLILSRRLRRVHYFRAAAALGLAAIIGFSWYLAVEHSNPGYLYYYFIERHVLGFLTNKQPHGSAPWWYYLPVLIVGGLPWVGYLPVLVQDTLERRRQHMPPLIDARGDRPLLFFACWFIGCTIFLTLSRSKLVTYIWPVFPAMAILAAVLWIRKMDGLLSASARRWMGRIVCYSCLAGPIALPATFAITEIALPTRFTPLAWTACILAALTTLAPIWSWRRGRDGLTLGLAATSVCGQLALLLVFAVPQVALALSSRDLAEYINRTRKLPDKMLLAQERVGSVLFYLDRDLRSRLQNGQIANLDIDDPLPSPPLDGRELVVIPERHLHTALHDYDLLTLPCEQAGRFRIYRRGDIEPRALLTESAAPVLR